MEFSCKSKLQNVQVFKEKVSQLQVAQDQGCLCLGISCKGACRREQRAGCGDSMELSDSWDLSEDDTALRRDTDVDQVWLGCSSQKQEPEWV